LLGKVLLRKFQQNFLFHSEIFYSAFEVTKKFLSHRKRIRFCHTFFIALFLPFSDVGYTLISGKFRKEIYK